MVHEQDLHLNDVPDEIIDIDLCYIQKVVDPDAWDKIQEKGITSVHKISDHHFCYFTVYKATPIQ